MQVTTIRPTWCEMINLRFQKMLADKSGTTFWKALKRITRSSTTECLTIKDENGKRMFHPEDMKETKALHYESLYRKIRLSTILIMT